MSPDLARLREAVAELPNAYFNGQVWRDGAMIKCAVRKQDWPTVLAYARVCDEARRLVGAEKDVNQNPPGESHGSPAM